MKISHITSKSFLTKSEMFDYTFNPYQGCSHDCKYCYAHYMKQYTKHTEPWGKYVDIKELEKYIIPKTTENITISTVTDPYQPIEAKYGKTREGLQHLIGFKGRVNILTKSHLVTRDIDLFKQIENISVGFSIATTDEKFRKVMEPGASPIEKRYQALMELHKAGIKTYVFICPIFPKLTNYKAIIEATKDYCDYYMFDKLNLRGENRQWVFSLIAQYAPILLPLYQRIYQYNDNEYWDLFDKQLKAYIQKENIPLQKDL